VTVIAGIEPAPIGGVLDELPAPLVDLALWVAEYYGSTPARALELVAPLKRSRRKVQPPPAERQSFAGEPEPAGLSQSQAQALRPVVAALARGAGSTVRLLRVFPVPERVMGAHGQTIAYVDQEMTRLTAAGLDELAHVEAQLDGIDVERVVRFGNPTDEIQLEAEAFGADLIALATTARGRLRAILTPGVAERVVGRSAVPTLVLHV